jgi:rhamnosyltransferase
MPKASIVIRTLNEGRFIAATLESLARQTFTDFEVLIVDSGSTDDTLSIASKYPVRLLHIEPSRFTYGRASNLGCEEAKGDIVVLLSAHSLPADETWLEALIAPLADDSVAGVCGRELPRPECNPFDRRGLLRRYQGVEAHDLTLDGHGIYFGTANGAIRRAVWLTLPFDEDLSFAEDYDWGRRAIASGYRLRYAPRAAAYHSHNETLTQIRKRFYNQATAERRLGLAARRNGVSGLAFDTVAGSLYDLVYAIPHPRWMLLAMPRRVAINFGRYAGYRGIASEAGFLEATFGRAVTNAIRRGNRFLSDRSATLVRLTGKSPYPLHPKHLLPSGESRDWYLPHLEAGARVLDVGCGHGAHAITTARTGAAVLGFDRSAADLRLARARASDAGVDTASFQVGDAEQGWPYRDASFDVVLALDVLEHVRGRTNFLRECRRVMRRGGKLLVAVPNRGNRWRRTLLRLGLPAYSDPDHKVEYSKDELESELASAGFRVESIAPVVYDTPWYGVIDATGGISLALYRRLAARKRRRALEQPEESNGFRVVAVPT